MPVKEEQKKNIDINFYISLCIRRKWTIILSMIPVLIAGIIYLLYTPKIYSTSTTIVLIPQQIPTSYVKPTFTGNIRLRIRTIWQEITSRTNLEKVIQQFNLYPKLRQQLPMESVVEYMRNQIKINSRDRGTTFILTYQGKDPVLITKVTNALANMFIEQNLKIRQLQAQTTTDFLEQQLQQVAQQLKQREDALRKFKMAHMGELPSQESANLAMLQRLQDQLNNVQQSINNSQDRLLLLERQLTEEEQRLKDQQSAYLNSSNNSSTNNQPVTLADLYAKLKALRAKYTDQYPDVIAVKMEIERLKKQQKQTKSNSKSKKVNNLTGINPQRNSVIVALQYQIKNTKLEIKALNAEKERLQKQIDIYNKRIEDTPKVEEELVELTRGYNTVRKIYDSLLSRKIAAEQAQALEQLQEGEQFRVIDPARIPQQPVKPKIKRVLAITFLASIAFAFGIAFVKDVMSGVFYDIDEIENELGLRVIACIPFIPTKEQKRKRLLKTIGLSFIALIGYGFVGVLLYLLWKHGAGSLNEILTDIKAKISLI